MADFVLVYWFIYHCSLICSKTSAALSSSAVSSAAPEPFVLPSDELEIEKRVTAGSSRTDEVMQSSHKEEMKQRFKAYAERTTDKPYVKHILVS